MSPPELWWFIDAKLPSPKVGSMSEGEAAELYEEMKAAGFEAQMQRTGEQFRGQV